MKCRTAACRTAGVSPASGGEVFTKAGETPAVRHLLLPESLRDSVAEQAARAYPRECCGLIEGVRRAARIEALRLHPARNLAEAADRFEIDAHEQFRLLRALRGTGRSIVGCYHSHPGGTAAPSPRDREGAGEEEFVWLIAGVRPGTAVTLAAFVFAMGDFRPLPLA